MGKIDLLAAAACVKCNATCISLCCCVQGLHVSKRKEQQTEEHMLKLAECEDGRLKQEIDKIQREMNDLKEKENMCEVMSSYVM